MKNVTSIKTLEAMQEKQYLLKRLQEEIEGMKDALREANYHIFKYKTLLDELKEIING